MSKTSIIRSIEQNYDTQIEQYECEINDLQLKLKKAKLDRSIMLSRAENTDFSDPYAILKEYGVFYLQNINRTYTGIQFNGLSVPYIVEADGIVLIQTKKDIDKLDIITIIDFDNIKDGIMTFRANIQVPYNATHAYWERVQNIMKADPQTSFTKACKIVDKNRRK